MTEISGIQSRFHTPGNAIDIESGSTTDIKVVLEACINALKNHPPCREFSVAATKIQEARMWIEEQERS